MANNWYITLPSPYTVTFSQGLYGNATMPAMTASGLIRTEATIKTPDGGAILPGLTATGRTGSTGAFTLPALIGSGSGTIPNLLRGAITLPAVTGAGSGAMGGYTSGLLTLPTLTATMARGWIFAKVLPSLSGSGSISHSLSLSVAATLPRLTGSGTISLTTHAVLRGNLILPAVVGMSGNGGGQMSLPRLLSSGSIVAGTAALRQAWVMNVASGGITRFTEFPFRQFARAYDRHYGAHLDAGLYTMGGDTDAGAPIAWEWHTGLSDVGSRGLKGTLALYLDGVAEKGCDFAVTTDLGVYWYGHAPHGTPNNHQTQRVPIGKALRSVNWAFGMRSTKGAYFEIDSITPEWQLSNRNL